MCEGLGGCSLLYLGAISSDFGGEQRWEHWKFLFHRNNYFHLFYNNVAITPDFPELVCFVFMARID